MGKKKVPAIVSAMGVLMTIITALVTAVKKHGGTDEDIHRLATPDGEALIDQIAELIVGSGKKAAYVAPALFLRRFSDGEQLIIPPMDGRDIFSRENDAVVYSADEIFGDQRTGGVGRPTGETKVAVYRVESASEKTTLEQAFRSLGSDLDSLCLTQAQIKGFVKKYRDQRAIPGTHGMRYYCSYFIFLIKFQERYLVAKISRDRDGDCSAHIVELDRLINKPIEPEWIMVVVPQ